VIKNPQEKREGQKKAKDFGEVKRRGVKRTKGGSREMERKKAHEGWAKWGKKAKKKREAKTRNQRAEKRGSSTNGQISEKERRDSRRGERGISQEERCEPPGGGKKKNEKKNAKKKKRNR